MATIELPDELLEDLVRYAESYRFARAHAEAAAILRRVLEHVPTYDPPPPSVPPDPLAPAAVSTLPYEGSQYRWR